MYINIYAVCQNLLLTHVEYHDLFHGTPQLTFEHDLQDKVTTPVHLKNFRKEELKQVCRELRADIINSVSATGGGTSLKIFLESQ